MDNATTANIEQGLLSATSDHIFRKPVRGHVALREHSEVFDDWFSRCRGLLHFTACRVLDGPEEAELAVQNRWRPAIHQHSTVKARSAVGF